MELYRRQQEQCHGYGGERPYHFHRDFQRRNDRRHRSGSPGFRNLVCQFERPALRSRNGLGCVTRWVALGDRGGWRRIPLGERGLAMIPGRLGQPQDSGLSASFFGQPLCRHRRRRTFPLYRNDPHPARASPKARQQGCGVPGIQSGGALAGAMTPAVPAILVGWAALAAAQKQTLTGARCATRLKTPTSSSVRLRPLPIIGGVFLRGMKSTMKKRERNQQGMENGIWGD